MGKGERVNLLCPYCGSPFEAILEYRPGSWSEHRDLTGYECENFKCMAEWDRFGKIRKEPKSVPSDPAGTYVVTELDRTAGAGLGLAAEAPSCPACGSLSHTITGATTTDMMFMPFTDDQGRRHHHDGNSVSMSAKCQACGETFSYTQPNTCWCGWSM